MNSYVNATKYQKAFELPNVAHFVVQNSFQQDLTRFTQGEWKSQFLAILIFWR